MVSREHLGNRSDLSNKKSLPKKYFFIFESRSTGTGQGTEYDYFTEISSIRNNMNITNIERESTFIKKFGPDENQSDLEELIEISYRRIEFYKNQKCHILEFANGVLHVIRKCFYSSDRKDERKKLREYLRYRSEIIDYISESQICKNNPIIQDADGNYDGYVGKDEFDDVYELVKQKILTDYPKNGLEFYTEYFKKTVLPQINPNFVKDGKKDLSFNLNDVMCVVHDRDYSPRHFNEEMYHRAIERLSYDGCPIRLYITSPQFELWLLMHHKEKYQTFISKYLNILNEHMRIAVTEGSYSHWRFVRDIVEFYLNNAEGRKDLRFIVEDDIIKYRYDPYNQKEEYMKSKNNEKNIIVKSNGIEDHTRFDTYYKPAIYDSTIFSYESCEDLKELSYNCGSNLPSLMNELFENHI